MTGPTPAQKKEVTDNGDVVIETDGRLAFGTVGSRKYNGLAPGDSVDAHVQEAANKRTQNKGKNGQPNRVDVFEQCH